MLAAKALPALLCFVPITWAVEIDQTRRVTTQYEQSASISSDQILADNWSLTLDEWHRYQTLMQGIRGSLSNPNISPYEVLGIHARSDAERRMFAERWAQMMFDDTARVLAFQREYHTAFRRLYAEVPAIDLAILRKADASGMAADFNPGDRLLFFTEISCTICQNVLKRLLESIENSVDVGLDIYFVHTSVDEAGDANVRTWALDQSIPAEWVRARRVTLNHDNGLLAQFDSNVRPPYVVHQSDGKQNVLRLRDLGP